MTVFRTAYGERFRVVTEFFAVDGEAIFHDECDINRVMDRWLKTGVLVHVNKFHGDYSDVSNFPRICKQLMSKSVLPKKPSALCRRWFGRSSGMIRRRSSISSPRKKIARRCMSLACPASRRCRRSEGRARG